MDILAGVLKCFVVVFVWVGGLLVLFFVAGWWWGGRFLCF